MKLITRFRRETKRINYHKSISCNLRNNPHALYSNNKFLYSTCFKRATLSSSFPSNNNHFSKYQRFTYTNKNKYYHPFYRFNINHCSSSSSAPVNDLLENIQDIEERQKCRSVMDALSLDPRVKMPLSEYMDLCKKHKISEDESKKLLSALHTTGIIWHFPKYFEEEKPLIIKTAEVCKAFLRSLDLSGEIRSEFVTSKTAQLKQYLLEIKPLEEQHEEIELYARKYVRNMWRFFFVYVCAHCMIVPYFTFWKYSWDIMEPVTYMFNLWTLFMGTWFFINTSGEFSNEGISSAILRMRKEKLYVKYNFDIERYTFLQEKIAEIEDDLLNPEWQMLKSVHPGLPDYIKHIHLTPSELIAKYQNQEMQQSEQTK